MFECIVIGAGPGGVACTKELIEQGLDNVLCLERADRVGGSFRQAYDSLTLTSSATFSMFSDFWVGDGHSHHFWSKAEAVDYWTRYADHFGVLARTRFGEEVVRVSDGGRGWSVELRSGERLATRRVALAVGNNSVPRYPRWSGALTDVGRSHSHEYRNAGDFRGKRVLVVGGGESASDVALEVASVAERCWVSLRESTGWVVPRMRGPMAADIATHRGAWGLPRAYGSIMTRRIIELERSRNDPVFDAVADLNERVPSRYGIWGTFGTKTLALPRAIAEHGARVVGDIVDVADGGRSLTTADGDVLRGVDAVVFCTGYTNRVDFLPEPLRACDPRTLYKHLFHPDLGDRMAWIGWARPNFGSQFPIMEMQARLFALVAQGAQRLPDAEAMRRAAAADQNAWIDQFEEVGRRVRSLVDYHRYMDDLAEIIGCMPPLWSYFVRHPGLWLRMVYGPLQGTQFRLRGPGRKVELAHAILGKLPVSGFNHVVRLGLRGRLRYALPFSDRAHRGVGRRSSIESMGAPVR